MHRQNWIRAFADLKLKETWPVPITQPHLSEISCCEHPRGLWVSYHLGEFTNLCPHLEGFLLCQNAHVHEGSVEKWVGHNPAMDLLATNPTNPK